MFFVNIDIFKSSNILYLDTLQKPFIVISARQQIGPASWSSGQGP
jgi:hypothetical protein